MTQDAYVEQEPVAKYLGECSEGSLVQLYDDVKKGTNFYTAPPQRTQEEPESECNPQDLCAGCRCKYAHVQPATPPQRTEEKNT